MAMEPGGRLGDKKYPDRKTGEIVLQSGCCPHKRKRLCVCAFCFEIFIETGFQCIGVHAVYHCRLR